MSAGYAARLSEYRHKGTVGLPESYDSQRQVKQKLRQLIDMMKTSTHTVVLTGAGISTSAGIPDFRGPKGIWTLEKKQQQQQKRKRASRKRSRSNSPINDDKNSTNVEEKQEKEETTPTMDFGRARPTLTHRAITKLVQEGDIQYCVTQNVDGLHRRSGLSRNHHCCLHGCAFTEVCKICHTEYFRTTDVGGMSFQPTGRFCNHCSKNEGGGANTAHSNPLYDTLLDWEDALPEEDWQRAQTECEKADLILCLGTSLRIEPAGSLPLAAKRFVIVNLQQTPKDEEADLIIRTSVDDVLQAVTTGLGYGSKWDKSSTSGRSTTAPTHSTTIPTPEDHPAIEWEWRPPL